MALSDAASSRPEAQSDAQDGITLRSGIVALVMLFCLAWTLPGWLLWMKGPPMPGGYLPLFAVAAVLLLLAIKHLPRPFSVKFSSGEMLGVFCILAVGLAALNALGQVIALLPTPYYYATPENDYRGHFLTEMPSFVVPFNPLAEGKIIDPIVYYRGLPGGATVPWNIWIGPLAWWLGLMGLVFAAQICMACLLRRQWLDNEKLMFPHVTMLTSLVEKQNANQPSIFKDRLFWYGAATSVFIFLLEGLNHYVPAVPSLGLTRLSMRDFLVAEPWASMRPELSIQPYLVGIAYLLTTEITFSIWFFAVFDNLLRVMGSAMTVTFPTQMAWLGSSLNSGADTVGALVVFTGVLIWTGRGHFKGMVRKAFWLSNNEDDQNEAMRYRTAFWGFWLSVAGILTWCVIAGIPLWFALLVFGLYGLGVVLVSRLVAETGLLTAQSGWLRPQMTAIRITGYQAGAVAGAQPPLLKALSVMSFAWPSLMLGPHLMPLVLTGFRATEGAVKKRRRVLWFSVFGLLLVMVVFSARMLDGIYARGALNSELGWFRESIWIFNNVLIRDILLRERSQVTDWTEVSFMGVGAVIMAFLLYMRRAFYWWPIHPIGFITTGIDRGLWFSFLIGWMIKRTVLKYGGGEAFKNLIGFFIGLFVGQFVMAIFWYLVGVAVGEVGVNIL